MTIFYNFPLHENFRTYVMTWKFKSTEVLWIRIRIRVGIHRIHMFLGLLDPDPLVRGMDSDPDPSIIMQK